MADCEITNDILYDCTNPPIAGAKDRIIIIPRRVIDSITLNGDNHLIVEAITLEAGERGYLYTGNGDLRSLTDQMVKDENGTRYLHGIPFKVFGATPVIKKELEYLSRENEGVVAILEQNYKGTSGNSRYVVLGKDCGLYVRMLESTDGKNIYSIELFSKDGYEEPHMAANFYITSEAITKTTVEALLVADTA